MRKEKNPLLLVDLPEYVIQNYMINDDLSVHQQARRALEKALPRYFDKKGNFTRLTVSFPFRMYEVDDKKGKGIRNLSPLDILCHKRNFRSVG